MCLRRLRARGWEWSRLKGRQRIVARTLKVAWRALTLDDWDQRIDEALVLADAREVCELAACRANT